MKPAISHRVHAITCVLRLQGDLLLYMGRESLQQGRQAGRQAGRTGPAGLLGATSAVATGQSIPGSPTCTPALQLLLD